MNRLLKSLEQVPMSLDAVRRYAPDDCRVVLYDHIPTTKAAFFNGKTSVIILFEMHKGGKLVPGVGHFSLVINRENKLYYFSSYGMKPTSEIKLTGSSDKLMKILGNDFEYNTFPFQKRRNTATCSFHVICRAFMVNLKPKEYRNIFGRQITLRNSDDIVTMICLLLLRREL